MNAAPPTFGELLKQHRTRAGLSQEALADRARLSANALGALERGERRSPYQSTIEALADALDLSEPERAGFRASARRFRGARRAMAGNLESTTRSTPSLPLQPTALVGRAHEVDAGRRLLLSDSVRLLTLSGPGGVGKTRLALAIAASVQGAFRDGVWLVDLAPLRDPSLVVPEIARTLRVHEQGSQWLASALQSYLQGRELLLLIDNFEHVLEAAPELAPLLSGSSALKLIVTSRARLRLRWEHLLPVDPFAVPDLTDWPDPSALAAQPAAALFIERARASDPTFALTPQNAPAVYALCRQLDGLPLAIELAAARANILSPQEMVQRAERGSPSLDWSTPDLPARQRSLRATLKWSIDLLSEAERTLFQRLAVFVGGWSLDALDPVARLGELGLDPMDGLGRLVDASLVQVSRQAGAAPRFGLLETMRELALQELEAHGERDAVERGHAFYYRSLAERVAPGLRGPDQGAWFDVMQHEQANFRAALAWAAAHDETETLVRLSGTLAYFWWRRGYLTEGLAWLEEGLTRSLEKRDAGRLSALQGAAWLAIHLGKFAEAASWLDEAKELATALGDGASVMRTIGMATLSAFTQGQIELRSELASDIEAARAAADVGSLAFALGALGNMSLEAGELDRASDVLEEAVDLSLRSGDRLGLSIALLRLARLAHARGDRVRTAELASRSAAAAREIASPGSMAGVLYLVLQVSMGLVPSRELTSLLGAAHSLQAAGILPLGLRWQAQTDQLHTALRDILGREMFEEAWDEGNAMTLEEFVEATLSAFEASGHQSTGQAGLPRV
jgi:predicted ATPase/DNA-binding XRE family transcriptional regulator